MSFYFIVLFFHITGALGIFTGLGLEWFIVHNFKRVTTYSQALQWTDSFRLLPAIFSISSMLILASGIYMWAETWGDTAWIIAGFWLFLFLAVFGSVIVGKKVRSIAEALKSESEKLSDSILVKIKSPVITQSLKIRTALALSIVFLMTIKPDWTVTLIVVGAALITGFLLSRILK
jgi:hypothetical protein